MLWRAQQIAARRYDIPYSGRRSLSVDTLWDWALRYRKDGLAALSPQPRPDRGQARAVPPETAALIERLKRQNPHRTGAALLRELALTSEQNKAGLSASTLYCFLVHHVRKSIGREEIGSAFRGSSALHAVGDSYLLLTRPSPGFHTVELRFQFRYAAPLSPRLLPLDPLGVAPERMPQTDATGLAPKKSAAETLQHRIPC